MKKRRPWRLKSATRNEDLSPLMRLWLLRILFPLGAHRQFIQAHGFSSDELASSLGIDHLDNPLTEFSPSAARAAIHKLHLAAEKKSSQNAGPVLLRANVERLGALIGLNEASIHILEFVALVKSSSLISEAAELLGSLSSLKVIQVLSVILAVPESEVRAALAPDAPLARSGLLQVDRDGSYGMNNKLNLLSTDLADAMVSLDGDPVRLLQNAVRLSSPGELGTADYVHIAPLFGLLRAYLDAALGAQRKGVNVLLHGKPGTGKNQLAKLMAREFSCDLLEVATEDSDGDPINGERRLRALKVAQAIFANRRALILFDEIEDVFSDASPLFGHRSTGQTRKAWVNRILEENPVPAFWLTNSVACLDPAFIRRFDMVIELPVPPLRQRKAIIEQASGGMLDAQAVDRLAASELIAPAVVARAASVVTLIRDQITEQQAGPAIERLISATLAAQGERPLKVGSSQQLPDTYDPAFINADIDLAAVAKSLAVAKSGRLCLYGPPGTGKSAYGRWLASELDMPLLVRRGSDLISKWVGQTEQNIAEAFRSADRDSAILLIDEVDSFLQDRRGAQRSWEVTQVNEMLTQMESFDGIIITSTNLIDGLDQAALRRFDIKAMFDFLRVDQAFNLLCRYCATQNLVPPSEIDHQALRQLDLITPGDFAVVDRRQRFGRLADAAQWIAAIVAECDLKEGSRRRIGF